MSATSDFYPDRGASVLAVTTATLVVASVFVFARLASRVFIVHHVALDDWFIALGWILAFGLSFAIDYGVEQGLGKPDVSIDPSKKNVLTRCEYAFSILYNPALMATKTSILLFYLRLSKNTKPLLRTASWITLGVVNVAGIILTFLNIFQCHPVAAVFQIDAPAETCIPLVTLYLASAPVNILTDLAILVLPIPVLTGMRLPQRQKNVLIFTFALGVFVTVVDVIRIYYLQQASADVASREMVVATTGFSNQPNFSWYASLSLMWSAVEVNIGLICACIPTLKPLISRILPVLIDHVPHTFTNKTESQSTSANHSDPHELEKEPGLLQPAHIAGRGSLVRGTTLPSSDTSARGPQAGLDMTNMQFLTTPYMSADLSSDNVKKQSTLLDPSMCPSTGPESIDFITSPGMVDSEARARARNASKGSLGAAANSTTNNSDENEQMGFLDFLAVDAEPGLPRRIIRTGTATTSVTDNTVYFGFVNMRRPSSMLRVRGWEALKYCTAVTILFFLWGFSYGLLNTLNGQIGKIQRGSTAQSIGLSSAYFGGYLFGPLAIGRYVLIMSGFKTTFISGLCIYAVGTLMFWPSAVLLSYPAFVVSNFVVAVGLSVLETAANPFLALCGNPEYAEARLLIAQGVQAVGSVVSPLLAQDVFFNELTTSSTLIDVQWTYLAIALFSVILALFFYYMPLPEATDQDLELRARYDHSTTYNRSQISGAEFVQTSNRHVVKPRLILILLALGISSQFFYVAAQESTSVFYETLLDDLVELSRDTLNISGFSYLLVGHTTFAIGRFMAAAVCLVLKPRVVLLICYFGCIVFSCLTFTLTGVTGDTAAAVLTILLFFEGPIFPLIFAIALRGQGHNTKSAASYITASVFAGAIFPWVMYATQQVKHASVQLSFTVPFVLAVFGTVFPLWLCLDKRARDEVDPRKTDSTSSAMALPIQERGHGPPRLRFGGVWRSGLRSRSGKQQAERANSEAPMVEHWEGRPESRADHPPNGVVAVDMAQRYS